MLCSNAACFRSVSFTANERNTLKGTDIRLQYALEKFICQQSMAIICNCQQNTEKCFPLEVHLAKLLPTEIGPEYQKAKT
jgi:hypothetical protein